MDFSAWMIEIGGILWCLIGYMAALDCYELDGLSPKTEGRLIWGILGGLITLAWKYYYIIPRNEVDALVD